MKKVTLILLALFVLYVAYLYITGRRETFIIPKGYEGVLLIIGNQKDGIEINKNHAIYDFTKSNIIKLKGDLITGFSPWGYLNYYEVDGNGEREKLETINEPPETVIENNKIYVWSYYFEIGNCNDVNYETIIISKKTTTDKIWTEKERLVNQEVCNKKAP
jgi:hypothetical protein